ncbi:hypothetical protein ACFC1R_34125 [Kitasatospora sp. NPDC056138]|uniref:hypothetical protein n=1 Tax=Kitasatospora sp. NPDC056138 TaxID=3345724 RepID=UPI0035D9B07D
MIEAGLSVAEQKLAAMRDLAARHTTVHLGMPDFRTGAGRLTTTKLWWRLTAVRPLVPRTWLLS